VRGAREEGIEGLGKGLVRGVLGVAVKPTVGIFDAASRATEGVRNAAHARRVWPRIRAPRLIEADGAVRPYDVRVDEGRFLCKSVGARPSMYKWHVYTTPEHVVLIRGSSVVYLFVSINGDEIAEVWQLDASAIWR
jgi:hypothetical protein